MARTDLTEQEWERLAPLLPSSEGKRGGQYKDHRQVLNGILWVLRTGAPWRDLPERYPPWKTCHDRLLRWQRQGIWVQILQALQRDADAAGHVDWEVVSVDGTTVRAHQHAAGARRPSSPADASAEAEKGGGGGRLRGTGAQSRRLHHQAAPLRRRARSTAVGVPDGRPAAREHATGAGAGSHPGSSPPGSTAQETQAGDGRQRVELPEVPQGAAPPGDPARDPGAAGPEEAAAGERLPGRAPAAF
jgi:transposase